MRIPAGFVKDIGELILEPYLKVWLNSKNCNFHIGKRICMVEIMQIIDRERTHQNCSSECNILLRWENGTNI